MEVSQKQRMSVRMQKQMDEMDNKVFILQMVFQPKNDSGPYVRRCK